MAAAVSRLETPHAQAESSNSFDPERYISELRAATGAEVMAMVSDGRVLALYEHYPHGARINDLERLVAVRDMEKRAPNWRRWLGDYCLTNGRFTYA